MPAAEIIVIALLAAFLGALAVSAFAIHKAGAFDASFSNWAFRLKVGRKPEARAKRRKK